MNQSQSVYAAIAAAAPRAPSTVEIATAAHLTLRQARTALSRLASQTQCIRQVRGGVALRWELNPGKPPPQFKALGAGKRKRSTHPERRLAPWPGPCDLAAAWPESGFRKVA